MAWTLASHPPTSHLHAQQAAREHREAAGAKAGESARAGAEAAGEAGKVCELVARWLAAQWCLKRQHCCPASTLCPCRPPPSHSPPPCPPTHTPWQMAKAPGGVAWETAGDAGEGAERAAGAAKERAAGAAQGVKEQAGVATDRAKEAAGEVRVCWLAGPAWRCAAAARAPIAPAC